MGRLRAGMHPDLLQTRVSGTSYLKYYEVLYTMPSVRIYCHEFIHKLSFTANIALITFCTCTQVRAKTFMHKYATMGQNKATERKLNLERKRLTDTVK